MSTRIWLLIGAFAAGAPPAYGQATPDASDSARASARNPRDTGGYLSDAGITTKVKAALLTDKSLKALGINVDTAEGVVTLSGNVPSTREMKQAEALAWRVQGVRGVRNALHLESGINRNS